MSYRFGRGGKLAVAFLAMAAGAARGQTPIEQVSPPVLAARIAREIDAHTVKAPAAALSFDFAEARYNMVELHFIARTPAAFATMKASLDALKLAKVRFYCSPDRIKALRAGVIFREVFANADHSQRLTFVVDLPSCSSPNVPDLPSDTKALAQMAHVAAMTESANFSGPSEVGIRLDDVTAITDEVQERFVVDKETVPTLAGQKLDRIKGVLTRFYCGRYTDFIHRGLVFHPRFVSSDSTALFDFTIDRSKCDA